MECDVWCSEMKEPNLVKAERRRNRSLVTRIYEHYLVRRGRGGTLGHLYPERIVVDSLIREDGQGCKKAAWPPQKSFTLLDTKVAGCGLKEHGEIEDGICLICLNVSFRNIARTAKCFSEQECHTTTSTSWRTHHVPPHIPWKCPNTAQ